jgi:hypothetical protein
VDGGVAVQVVFHLFLQRTSSGLVSMDSSEQHRLSSISFDGYGAAISVLIVVLIGSFGVASMAGFD